MSGRTGERKYIGISTFIVYCPMLHDIPYDGCAHISVEHL
jgi:hypothetical protein